MTNVRDAWGLAFTKGYCEQALVDYTAPDFAKFAVALIPGLMTALLLPIAGQAAGGLAGTGLAAAVTAVSGQAELDPIIVNGGRVLGLLAAEVALGYLGLKFLKDFLLPRIGASGEHFCERTLPRL